MRYCPSSGLARYWPFSTMTLPRSMVVHRPGEDLVAFPRRVVGFVQISRAHLAAPARIEDGDIGIAAGGDRAFPRIKAHDLRGIGRDQIHVLRQRVAAAHDHLGVHDAKPRLDAGIAAGRVVDALAECLVS